jgi:hypothetical protein
LRACERKQKREDERVKGPVESHSDVRVAVSLVAR